MTLGLDILALTKPGRKPALRAEAGRELTAEDLGRLAGARGTEPTEVKRLSERHHALARLLSSGMGTVEAAALLGYTASRVSILRSSPAFQELMALYESEKDDAFRDTAARLAGLTYEAITEIQNRLEEEPEKISIGQLIEISKLAADRSGFGPKQTQEVNVNVNLAARLDAARNRIRTVEDAEEVRRIG
jgi:hypothetical protein